MTCVCICGCKSEQNGMLDPKQMCEICRLMNELNSPQHQLPIQPQPDIALEPEAAVSDAQKDEALRTWAARNGI